MRTTPWLFLRPGAVLAVWFLIGGCAFNPSPRDTFAQSGGPDGASERPSRPDGGADADCQPVQCTSSGGSYCGSFPDGCGGLAVCGDCAGGLICGTDHVCVSSQDCKPVSCTGPGYQFCGVIGDGCNHALDCGTCPSPQTCGGGGADHVCGP
jgi:hypothetical protein